VGIPSLAWRAKVRTSAEARRKTRGLVSKMSCECRGTSMRCIRAMLLKKTDSPG
jgi:hypothetical protein